MIATGKNPDGNGGMCRALKEPNKTVKGDHFRAPRQSRAREEDRRDEVF